MAQIHFSKKTFDFLALNTVNAIKNESPAGLVNALAAYYYQYPLLTDKEENKIEKVIEDIKTIILNSDEQDQINRSIYSTGLEFIKTKANNQNGVDKINSYLFNRETYLIEYNDMKLNYTVDNALEFLCFLYVDKKNLTRMLSILYMMYAKCSYYYSVQEQQNKGECVTLTNSKRDVIALFNQLMAENECNAQATTSKSSKSTPSPTSNSQPNNGRSIPGQRHRDQHRRNLQTLPPRPIQPSHTPNTPNNISEDLSPYINKLERIKNVIMTLNSANCGKNAMIFSNMELSKQIFDCIIRNFFSIPYPEYTDDKTKIDKIRDNFSSLLKDKKEFEELLEKKQTDNEEKIKMINYISLKIKTTIYNIWMPIKNEIKTFIENAKNKIKNTNTSYTKTIDDLIQEISVEQRGILSGMNGESKCGFCTPSNEAGPDANPGAGSGRGVGGGRRAGGEGFVRERHLIF